MFQRSISSRESSGAARGGEPLSLLSQSTPMIYEAAIERLLLHFTADKYKEELAHAKREFFEQAGIVDEEAPNFEMRMAQFLDWYLFSRELSKEHVTPVRLVLESSRENKYQSKNWAMRI